MGYAMHRGAEVCLPHQRVGEAAAQERLSWFTHGVIDGYKDDRNLPGVDGTSGMSENLALGEISPRQCWHAGLRALDQGAKGAETWLKELVWREFAYHLMYHTPHILTDNWRRGLGCLPVVNRPRAPACHRLETGPHRRAVRRCRDARDVCHRQDAQPRAG